MRDLSSWKVLIAAVTVAVSLSAGCAKTITDALDDTTITTRVKTAMLNDPVIGALPIDVATTRSVVTLSGRVKSQTERDQALALARQVSGVSEVKDALQIIPAAQ
jgi:hyperosmotically inducible periplasmic protein